MAYDANPAATHDPTTGVVVPTAWLDLINSNFAEIGSAWTAYTPTWSTSGTAPSLGNGTLSGAYKKLGKTLYVRVRWVAGSTTTFGTGSYFFDLPPGVTTVGSVQALSAKGYDASTGNNYVLSAFVIASGTHIEAISNGASSVGATSPVTWATSDELIFTGVLEIS
ncbi:MAG TPA: hypothetical protein VHC63_13295 [Acidimicrobiales bacterium]|nr:hypothetical protein [Acidimicrobiales bacterium]